MFKNKQYLIIEGILIVIASLFFINSVFALMPVSSKSQTNVQAKTISPVKVLKPMELNSQSFLYKMDALNQKIQILEKQAKIIELKNKIEDSSKKKNEEKPKIDFFSTQHFNPEPKLSEKKEKKEKKKILSPLPVVINEEGKDGKIFASLLYPNGQTQIVKTGETLFLRNTSFHITDINPQGVILQNIRHPKKRLFLNLSYKLTHQVVNSKQEINTGRNRLNFLNNKIFDSTHR